MRNKNKTGKGEFVEMMLKKAYSKDKKPEPYIARITTEKDPDLKPFKESVNQKEIEELTEKLKLKLADKKK